MSSPKRVIVADDDADQRAVLALMLRRRGFDVLEACDGRELIDLVLRHSRLGFPSDIALILSDIMMPGLTGLDALQQLGPRCPSPVIFVSAIADTHAREAALRLGARGFLQKPFDSDDFQRVLDDALVALAPRNHDFATTLLRASANLFASGLI